MAEHDVKEIEEWARSVEPEDLRAHSQESFRDHRAQMRERARESRDNKVRLSLYIEPELLEVLEERSEGRPKELARDVLREWGRAGSRSRGRLSSHWRLLHLLERRLFDSELKSGARGDEREMLFLMHMLLDSCFMGEHALEQIMSRLDDIERRLEAGE